MFVCGVCRKKWWRNGDCSRCSGCHQVLSALPRDKEYGVGVHNCHCGKQFYSRTRANVKSRCYECNALCLPRIVPNKETSNRKSENTHSCKMCNGKGNCPNFNPIVFTSTTVKHVGDVKKNFYYDQDKEYDVDDYDEPDDDYVDDYYDECDDDCDNQDYEWDDDYYDDDACHDESDDDYHQWYVRQYGHHSDNDD